MRILRGINNNAALAIDDEGRELVIFGKGVGFPAGEHELADPSVIDRRFYNFDNTLLPMIGTLREDVIAASSDIVSMARDELACTLNPNLVFTLSDHLQFAMAHTSDGVEFENPLAPQIELVYPSETSIGRRALQICRERCGVELAETEAHAIALHIVNAEASATGHGNMDFVIKSTQIVEDVLRVVETWLGAAIDRTSYPYMRFVTHLRFLVARVMGARGMPDSPANDRAAALLPGVVRDFPEAAECAKAINAYLITNFDWSCSDEELLYLMLHTNRFITGQ